ncbi:hypothetical protein ASPVEDRAFT_796978 [Aspergillus versicolor CBS 583.65]|uniref:Uncharacterized protein n=1 Tax=Aspergillus versicolor CBS 583.65 TaxID=1036611 RepID=A0A1L9PSP3_ASPVE|nr:uncharacterized protein ASPVEDRAFT_796978 [Aspergillus versicolor CBS 583.65]OJJ04560.1 hypothetical protein ASPVEDRAFT_796978 [Aspergillus versicolor CBS 583.65]
MTANKQGARRDKDWASQEQLLHPASRMQGESAQTSSNLGREQDCMEPTPVGLRACLSDVPPRGLRRQLTRARLALRGMGHPGFQVAQEAGTERRIRAPATHHLFRGSTRVHWPGSWMEASRQTGPFPPSEMKALPALKRIAARLSQGVSTPSSIQDHLGFSSASTSLFLQLLGWGRDSRKQAAAGSPLRGRPNMAAG